MSDFHVQHIYFNREEKGEPSYSLMSVIPFLAEEDQYQIGAACPPMTIRENNAGILNKYLRKVSEFRKHHGFDLYEGQLDSELENLLSLYLHHGWLLVSSCAIGADESVLFFRKCSTTADGTGLSERRPE